MSVTPLPRVRIVRLDAATLAALADGDLARAELTSPVPLDGLEVVLELDVSQDR
ncbi:hypothetical protein [Nocardioides panaciterrulae]|uniref:Uncharacterized protein n=1 Tax=Nocardioides panaciterrulae TaxID=661492 RepID=A0A7Y9E5W2_9ACTN|nr:hypothetical protein [Nocardioides panaciterrulae]NYD41788.1 hypothetical protein [Nocardioides panaciterrulae]